MSSALFSDGDAFPPLEDYDDVPDFEADEDDEPKASWRNPNPGHCRVCGDPVKMPRQYCDAHQSHKAGKHPPKARKPAPQQQSVGPGPGTPPPVPARSSRTKARPTDKLAALEQDLSDQISVASLMLQVGVPVTGRWMQNRSARIARDMTNIARRYPAVADYLTTASEGLVFLGIAEDGLGLAAALRVDVGRADPYGPINRLTGVTKAYQDVIKERGVEDQWALMHELERAEAEAKRDRHIAEAAAAQAAAASANGAGLVDPATGLPVAAA